MFLVENMTQILRYDDKRNNLLEINSIVSEMVKLEVDYEKYMNDGTNRGEILLELLTKEGLKVFDINGKETSNISGNEQLKTYRIGLYESICEAIKEKEEIVINA